MEEKEPLPDSVLQRRRALHFFGLMPLCLFVAGYCMCAGSASGGWRTDREGESYYSPPVHYTSEFYTGLRWSVMVVGGGMATTSFCWKHPRVGAVFSLVAILFNPIIPIHLSKGTWEIMDLLAFWVFFVGSGYLRDDR